MAQAILTASNSGNLLGQRPGSLRNPPLRRFNKENSTRDDAESVARFGLQEDGCPRGPGAPRSPQADQHAPRCACPCGPLSGSCFCPGLPSRDVFAPCFFPAVPPTPETTSHRYSARSASDGVCTRARNAPVTPRGEHVGPRDRCANPSESARGPTVPPSEQGAPRRCHAGTVPAQTRKEGAGVWRHASPRDRGAEPALRSPHFTDEGVEEEKKPGRWSSGGGGAKAQDLTTRAPEPFPDPRLCPAVRGPQTGHQRGAYPSQTQAEPDAQTPAT